MGKPLPNPQKPTSWVRKPLDKPNLEEIIISHKTINNPCKDHKTVKITDNLIIYTFSSWKAWKRLETYIDITIKSYPVKNPLNCKILTWMKYNTIKYSSSGK